MNTQRHRTDDALADAKRYADLKTTLHTLHLALGIMTFFTYLGALGIIMSLISINSFHFSTSAVVACAVSAVLLYPTYRRWRWVKQQKSILGRKLKEYKKPIIYIRNQR